MRPQALGLLAMAGSAVLANAALGADPRPAAPPTAAPAAVAVQTDEENAAVETKAPEAAKPAPAPGAGGTPMTPEQRLEAGKKAVQATCVEGGCHAPEKWHGAAWDREYWARMLDAMFEKMIEFEKPLPPPATYDLILDYMAATYPQKARCAVLFSGMRS